MIVVRYPWSKIRFTPVLPVRTIGRPLQIVGLGVPPVSIFMQLTEAISLGQMLTLLVASVCCFGIGRILEGYNR